MFEPLPIPESRDPGANRRNRWAVVDLIVFALFFLLMLVLMAQFPKVSPIYAIPLQAVFNIALVGFIANWVKLVRGLSFTEYIHWRRDRTFSTAYLIALGATSAISVLMISAFLPPSSPTPLEQFLTSKSTIVMFAIFGVAVAPLLEEIVFRGFLFKVLWEIGGSGLAILVTAVLFALLHSFQLAGNWGSVLLIFAVGCLLGGLRYRSDSTVASVIVHTSYNTVLFALYVIGSIVQKIFSS